jgi:hypothetical protein
MNRRGLVHRDPHEMLSEKHIILKAKSNPISLACAIIREAFFIH